MDNWAPAFKLIGIGFYIGLCIAGGLLGGLWLDNKVHSKPLFLLLGLVLGLVVASWGVYKTIAAVLPKDNNINMRKGDKK